MPLPKASSSKNFSHKAIQICNADLIEKKVIEFDYFGWQTFLRIEQSRYFSSISFQFFVDALNQFSPSLACFLWSIFNS